MKAILCFLILGFSYNPDTTGNATVSKIQGIEIYVYSQPTADAVIYDLNYSRWEAISY